MSALLSLAPALIIACVCLCALIKNVDVMDAMTAGAKKGLCTVRDMLPALIVLFSAIYLLRASPLPAVLARLLAPALRLFGIPEETSLLLLLRPLSGSGAMSAAADIMTRCGLHCAPSAHKTLGTFPQGTVRFSIGYANAECDVDAAISAIKEILR